MITDDVRIEAGQRTLVTLPLNIAGISFDLPVFRIRGSEPGPRVTITAGIHGGEYPCVEAAVRLGRSLDPTAIRGDIVIVPSANPVAFFARSVYITPPDGLNLNRQFPGKRNGTFTEQWAAWLFDNVISGSDVYIDMHGGDMVEALIPFVAYNVHGEDAVDDVSRKVARAFGISHILERKIDPGEDIPGTTFGAAAARGIPALLVEAGGQGLCDEASVLILKDGCERVLNALGMATLEVQAGEEPTHLEGWYWLRATHDGLFYPAVHVGETVRKGQYLGRIDDFAGTRLQECPAPGTGTVLFLVTSLAMNEGDPLMAIAY